MSILYESIVSVLDMLIPESDVMFNEFSSFNRLLAYFLTIALLWSFFIQPLVKLLKKNK